MKRFEYKITKHSADTFDKIIYFCSKSGQCGIDEVSKDQTRILTDVLNTQGKEGWELVQISFGKSVGFHKLFIGLLSFNICYELFDCYSYCLHFRNSVLQVRGRSNVGAHIVTADSQLSRT